MNSNFPYSYICIEGNIGAGKTSFCELLQKDFNCSLILEEFDENPFLPFFYNEPDRFAFSVELFFMTERHKQMQRKLLNRDLFYDFTVSDYAFIKTLLFARKNLKVEEYKLFQQLFTVLSKAFPKPDLLVYFHRSPEILLKHIRNRGRDYEEKITLQYLQGIQDSYFEYFRNILSYPILIIDLNRVDFVESRSNYETLKSLMKKQYNPGVHRVSLVT